MPLKWQLQSFQGTVQGRAGQTTDSDDDIDRNAADGPDADRTIVKDDSTLELDG